MEPHKLYPNPTQVAKSSTTIVSSDVTCPSQVNHVPEVTSGAEPSLEKEPDVERQTKKQCTKRKIFSCRFCDYVTNRKGNRDTHLRTHSGERPYKCRFCHYAAAYRSSVVVHERRHTGERPYRCPACTYSALQKTSLNQHMLKHHPSHWHAFITKAGRADHLTTHPTTSADSKAVGHTTAGRKVACLSLEPPGDNQRQGGNTAATEAHCKIIRSATQQDTEDRTLNGLLNFSQKEGQVPRRPSVIRKVEDSTSSEVEVDVTTLGQIQENVFLTIPSVRPRISNNGSYSHTKATEHRQVSKQNQDRVENSSSQKCPGISCMETKEETFGSLQSSSADVQDKTSSTGGAFRARTVAMRPSSDPFSQQRESSGPSASKYNVYPLGSHEDITLGMQIGPSMSETQIADALRLEKVAFPGHTALGIAPSYDIVTVEANPREGLFHYNHHGQMLHEVPSVLQGSYVCYYCGIIFTDKTMHDIHASYHGQPAEPFCCNMCGLLCPDRYAFYMHLHRATHR